MYLSRWVSDSLWERKGGKKKKPALCYHQKKHSPGIDCQNWKMHGKPSSATLSFCTWVGWTQKETGALIFSRTDRMLALCGGKNIHCLPDTVLSLCSDPIFLLSNKYFWSTYCVLVHLLGAGEEIYIIYVCIYISPFLCWFSVHFIITVSFSSQWAGLIAAGPKGQKHTET